MARIRSIKPESFTSEVLCDVPIAARWTFAGLWTYCDDKGRGKADARLIKAAIYPLDDDVTVEVIEVHLAELERVGVLCRYTIAGRRFVHVVNFREHQHPSKPQPSKFPECPGVVDGGPPEGSHTIPEPFPERSGNSQGAFPVGVVVGKGGEGEGEREVSAVALRDDRADAERLCTHLADRIEGNGVKRPAITTKWREAARLMLDRDKRPEAEIHAAIDWCQAHEFWRSNVLSMPKLREQYDRLRLQAEREHSDGRAAHSTTDQRVGVGAALIEKYAREEGIA